MMAGGVADAEWTQFMQFTACFFGNMGNYLDFGDTKFVPRCSKKTFTSVIEASSVCGTLLPEVKFSAVQFHSRAKGPGTS
jgi:hypothetical protein